MPVDISDSLCLLSASVNVALSCTRALPFPDLTVDEIDTLAKVEEVATVKLADQITRCSSVQFGGNVMMK